MRLRSPGKRTTVLALALVLGMPLGAYLLAPTPATARVAIPASGLAGLNTRATSSAIKLELLTPGIVAVGDAARGNIVSASLPYALSTATTGPSTSGVASPAWPGEVVVGTGGAIGTFFPTVPPAIVSLLNYPAAAYSAYPAQARASGSDNFSPTGGQVGVGTASTTSTAGATTAQAALNDTAPLGKNAASSPLLHSILPALKHTLRAKLKGTSYAAKLESAAFIQVGSATSSTSATLNTSSVTTTGSSKLSHVSILGLIEIDGVSSDATASSDGSTGKQRSALKIGNVTVAGQGASIGPDGITLNGSSPAGLPNPASAANAVLLALRQVGLSISVIAPVGSQDGGQASVTSGALEISFIDQNLPNLSAIVPALPVPLPTSLGVELTLGRSQASADATPLPGFGIIGAPGSVAPGVEGATVSNVPDTGTVPQGPGGETIQSSQGAESGQSEALAPATVAFGIPLRVAWVLIAIVLSFFAAGALVAYANWQLLRGRTP